MNNNYIKVPVFCLLILIGCDSHCVQSTDKDFIKAEKIALSGNKRNYLKALAALDHPLKPYVKMAYLKKHPYLSNQAEIEKFLKTYQGTPLEWPVRKAWLKYLIKRNKKKLYVNAFKDTKNVELTCHNLNFKLQLGAPEKQIFEQVTALWLVDKSQPKACDGLFKKWRKKGLMTQELIWQRLTLVAQHGQHNLIPYLTRQLPKNERYLGELYHKMRRDPSASAGLYRFKKATQKEGEIAIYGIKRLIWRDTDLALRAWQKLEKKFDFEDQQKQGVYYTFAIALASKKHPEAKFWLNKVPVHKHDKKLMQWQLSNMLQARDWPGVIAYFTGKSNLSHGQHYWLAYAHLKKGEGEAALKIWQELAVKRNYYGFMSAARLGLPVGLEYQAIEIATETKELVENAPGFVRAKALHELKRFTSARREWNYLINTSTQGEKLAAAELAHHLDWHGDVIRTVAGMGEYNYLDLRFPKAYEALFKKYTKKNKIDLSWGYAISRRESSFVAQARSKAGAVGLMQLLPSTAKYIAKSHVNRRKLIEPKTNIKLGTKYLSYLKRKNNNNEILATASYNAGYHRVLKWLPEDPIEVELWIESIPYKETRDYVKNVFAYRQVYHTRMGNTDNLFDQLLEMKIKK